MLTKLNLQQEQYCNCTNIFDQTFQLRDKRKKVKDRVRNFKPFYNIGIIAGFFLSIGFSILLAGCANTKASYYPEKKYAPEQLQEDARILWKTLQQCHPSLYWYTPQQSLDSTFNLMIASLQDSLTELQFRTRLSYTVAKIHCGHTSIRNSKAANNYRDKSLKPFFPLQVKTWNGDSMIVLANAYRRDSLLVRGSSIQTINGLPVKKVIDSICQFISADGWHNNFKYQLISNNFPGWYKAIFGLSEQYELEFTTADGKPQKVAIKNFDLVYEDSVRKALAKTPGLHPSPPPIRSGAPRRRLEDDRKLTIDTGRSLAIMELNTFSKAHLPAFFRKSFRKLRQQNIRHLAIELRENGGGNIINSTRLARYISDHPFKVADTVAAKSLEYPYRGLIKNGWVYKMQSWFVTSRKNDDRLHYRMYEKKMFKPYANRHYNGQVYIMTGGFTFSASTLFINPLKGQKNVTVIGEETGGGAYGNSAVNVPDLRLPNTNVRVRLPLYRLVVNKELPHNGRGILPDIYVAPSSWHLARRVDPKMMKVYELVKQAN
ncbi:MAG: S41 family peptidase [Bacteroidota bacterium]